MLTALVFVIYIWTKHPDGQFAVVKIRQRTNEAAYFISCEQLCYNSQLSKKQIKPFDYFNLRFIFEGDVIRSFSFSLPLSNIDTSELKWTPSYQWTINDCLIARICYMFI